MTVLFLGSFKNVFEAVKIFFEKNRVQQHWNTFVIQEWTIKKFNLIARSSLPSPFCLH